MPAANPTVDATAATLTVTSMTLDNLMQPAIRHRYETFLFGLANDSGLLYYAPPYLAMLADLFEASAQLQVLVAERGNTITGCLPLMVCDGPLGKVINALPFFGSHGGLLTDDMDTARVLAGAWHDTLDTIEPVAATMITNPFCPLDLAPLRDTLPIDATDERIAQFIDLTDWGDGNVWAHMDVDRFAEKLGDTARRNVRKAFKSGVTIAVDNSAEALAFLRHTHTTTMADQGGTVKPAAFFDGLTRWFEPHTHYNIYVARQDGQRVAALLVFYWHRTMEYFVPVTLPDARNSQPMAAILYAALKDAGMRGMTRFNWGGTWLSQTGVYQFKKKWNTNESRYFYWTSLHPGHARTLKTQTPQALIDAYPYWYVLPFNLLALPDTLPHPARPPRGEATAGSAHR
ncbi:MAG: GNAT family N-acetyltransferase [Cyanobacteria bacterium HKST-UBA05]|nr:GNAT family N-acetyltransferase [Cyanobacteria bacterium HKST-UBA05]